MFILEAVILSATLSADAFAAAFAYGGNGVKINIWKAAIISIVSSAVLGISLFTGTAVRGFFPLWLTAWLCFIILFSIGIIKIFATKKEDGAAKTLSGTEAVILAAALSLDGLAVGFGAAMGNMNIIAALAASVVMNLLAVMVGCRLGISFSKKLSRKVNLNRLAGIILIGLAVFKLL